MKFLCLDPLPFLPQRSYRHALFHLVDRGLERALRVCRNDPFTNRRKTLENRQ